MTKASDNVFPRLLISEGGSTATPAASQVTVYAKANGLLYSKDDAGTETALGGSSIPVGSGARVYNNANISIADNTSTALTFNSERNDTDTYHSTASNQSRLVAPTTGIYIFGGSIKWDTNDTDGFRSLGLRLDGTTNLGNTEMIATAVALAGPRQTIVGMYFLTAAQYIELMVFQNSGSAVNIIAEGNRSPEFWIARLGS